SRQFGERIVSLAAARGLGVLTGRQIAVPTMIAISHELRPVPGVSPRPKKPEILDLSCRDFRAAAQSDRIIIASRLAPRPQARPVPMRARRQPPEQAQAEPRSVVDHSG